MTTATQEAVITDESSAITKPNTGGRPVGYSPQLPFTTGKLCKGLAENAFKEFVKLNELCESGKATSEDLTHLLIKQSVAGLEVRKAASLVWLTQGMLLHALKESVKEDGKNWMDYFDQELSGPLNLSPRSEQLQRKMFTDWQQATSAMPEQTAKALEECEQVNDLASKLKKLSAGRDPWATTDETPTLEVDKSTKERQAFQRSIEKLIEQGKKAGYPPSTLGLLNDAFDDFQTYSVDAVAVTNSNVQTVDVEDISDDPDDLLESAISDHLEAAAA